MVKTTMNQAWSRVGHQLYTQDDVNLIKSKYNTSTLTCKKIFISVLKVYCWMLEVSIKTTLSNALKESK